MSEPAKTILVVEDDPNDVLLIRRAFDRARLPYRLEVVGDGESAVAYLAGGAPYEDRARYPVPALVLLDLKLPRKSGFEVLEWLRAQPVLRRMPVVILSSSNHGSDINRAYDLGTNSYLVKPVRFEDLRKIVESVQVYWLDLNAAPDTLERTSPP